LRSISIGSWSSREGKPGWLDVVRIRLFGN
jgi:hypothetical protein